MINSTDFTFTNGYLGLLSTLGALLGVICCCATSLRPAVNEVREILRALFRKARKVFFQSEKTDRPETLQTDVTSEIDIDQNRRASCIVTEDDWHEPGTRRLCPCGCLLGYPHVP